ncbi:MAG: hypothetical protein LBT26_00680, partial [Clostridiales Family XIII bacterium]|nr:hypothetical protein [Clostridiales Family XIII bacterium]
LFFSIIRVARRRVKENYITAATPICNLYTYYTVNGIQLQHMFGNFLKKFCRSLLFIMAKY